MKLNTARCMFPSKTLFPCHLLVLTIFSGQYYRQVVKQNDEFSDHGNENGLKHLKNKRTITAKEAKNNDKAAKTALLRRFTARDNSGFSNKSGTRVSRL